MPSQMQDPKVPGRKKEMHADIVDLFGDDAKVTGAVDIPAPGVNKSVGGDNRPNREVRVQLGKRWSEILTAVENEEYTWSELASSLTPTELARGQLADRNGGFSGRPPTFIPRAFYDACIRELLSRGAALYKENYVASIVAMTSIAVDPAVKPGDRIKAAQFVIERIEGKVPDRVEVSAVDSPFKAMVEGAIAEVQENQAIANAQAYLDRR